MSWGSVFVLLAIFTELDARDDARGDAKGDAKGDANREKRCSRMKLKTVWPRRSHPRAGSGLCIEVEGPEEATDGLPCVTPGSSMAGFLVTATAKTQAPAGFVGFSTSVEGPELPRMDVSVQGLPGQSVSLSSFVEGREYKMGNKNRRRVFLQVRESLSRCRQLKGLWFTLGGRCRGKSGGRL